MKQIDFYVPKLNQLSFRQLCLEDEQTMSYNAGYNLNIEGYNKATGCIKFPKQKWQQWYNLKVNNKNNYFAYIVDMQTKNYVGMVNINKLKNGSASFGINVYSKFMGMGYMRPSVVKLIEVAKQMEVKTLTNTLPETNQKALNVLYSLGFKNVDYHMVTKFNGQEKVLTIELNLK